MKLLYEGKAKQLFECENNDEIYVLQHLMELRKKNSKAKVCLIIL